MTNHALVKELSAVLELEIEAFAELTPNELQAFRWQVQAEQDSEEETERVLIARLKDCRGRRARLESLEDAIADKLIEQEFRCMEKGCKANGEMEMFRKRLLKFLSRYKVPA